MTITIREARQDDLASIRAIHLEAFPEAEGHLIAELAADLLREESDPETVSLVAVGGDEVVGHVAFSPVHANGRTRTRCVGYILAPLALKPTWQRRGIGTRLVESGMATLTAKGIPTAFLSMEIPGTTADSDFRPNRLRDSCRPIR